MGTGIKQILGPAARDTGDDAVTFKEVIKTMALHQKTGRVSLHHTAVTEFRHTVM